MDIPFLFKEIDAARNARFGKTKFVAHIYGAHVRLPFMQQKNGLQIHFFRLSRPLDSHAARLLSYYFLLIILYSDKKVKEENAGR